MTDDESVQERDWQRLHDRISAILDSFGRKDAFGEGDYWLLDDNWGWWRHQVEAQNLDMLKPPVIEALRALLAEYPEWDITMRVAVPGKENEWPGMGLIIHHDEVEDELQREFLPLEFRDIGYAVRGT